jgi:D-alanyl-lipoteichoic acid acyltransferase DltB (MBOAT superfamily)
MDFLAPRFLLFVLVGLVAFRLAHARQSARPVMAVLNAVFIAALASRWTELVPLALFVAAGFIVVKIIERRRTPEAVVGAVTAIVVVFVSLKRYAFLAFLPPLGRPYVTVGLSYLLFRIIHLAVDVHESAIPERIDWLDFFNYTCSFLTFVSGPLQRFQDYARDVGDSGRIELDEHSISALIVRVVKGYLKLAIASPVLLKLHGLLAARLTAAGIAPYESSPLYAGSAFLYVMYFYFNFSGYMDVVIGLGRLFGFRLPENFNRPFQCANFLDFWSRFHITLTEWFKFYIFNPMVGALVVRWPLRRFYTAYASAAIFVTFLLMGLWHGATTGFLLYGLFLGFGASANMLYGYMSRGALGRDRHIRWSALPSYRLLCGGLALTYWTMGVSCFWMDLSALKRTAVALGAGGLAEAFTMLTLTYMGVAIAARTARSLAQSAMEAFPQLSGAPVFVHWNGPLLRSSQPSELFSAKYFWWLAPWLIVLFLLAVSFLLSKGMPTDLIYGRF